MIQATARFTPRNSAGQFVQSVISPAVKASVEAAGEMIAKDAQALCPVDTGALRDSITSEVVETDKTVTAKVGPRGIPYASFVEYGTGQRGAESEGAGPWPYSPNWPGMAAQPYMRPAVDGAHEAILDLFRSNISVELKP